MMKLSTRSTYGMRALVELAFASGHGPVSAAVIAQRQNLSVAYLEQLLHRLKKQGIVTSVRGPRGGYMLAARPNQITMADVVLALEGQDGGWNGQHDTERGRTTPPKSRAKDAHRRAQRIAGAVWRCVHERLTQSLGAITLQDLCEEVRTASGEPIDHRYVFHI